MENPDVLLELLRNGKRLQESSAYVALEAVKEILFQEGTLHPVSAPVVVCGDIHGQLFDLFKLFEVSGGIESNTFLFLGDYVDRGYYSLETFVYLVLLKLKYRDRIILLRGNHECRAVNQLYGFYDECTTIYGNAMLWKQCNEVFDLLPMAALIDNKIFCVHGGLSPEVRLIDQITLEDRQKELPSQGMFSDITWSDPDDVDGWIPNMRGAGWCFGKQPVNQFCHNNKIELVARAHQLARAGYKYPFGERNIVTIWSAPNYMYRTNNDASVMKLDKELNREFVVFQAVPEEERIIPDHSVPSYFA